MNPANNDYGGPGGGQGRPILGKFSLSAAAPEFVPRGFMPAAQNGMGMAPNQPMFETHGQVHIPAHMNRDQFQMAQPQGGNMYMSQPSHGPMHRGGHHQHNYNSHRGGNSHHHYGGRHGSGSRHQAPQQASSFSDPMAQLKQAILILTKEPTSFDEVMPDLTSTLSSTIQNEERLIKMVEEIFRQSVEEANFRYTGARISNYFSHHLTVNFWSKTFKEHFLNRCHVESSKREDLVKNCDHRYKLVAFTLFMGEVLLNLTEFSSVESNQEHMTTVAQSVQELLLTHLSQPADDTLRCVVQVLKLCGSVLEDTEKRVTGNNSTPNVDSIFATIKDSVLESSYHKGMRAQMLSVIELRASDWGRTSSSHQTAAPPPPPASSANSAPVAQAPPNPNAVPFNNQSNFGNNVYYEEAGGGGGNDPNLFGNYYPGEDAYYCSSGEEEWQNPEDYVYVCEGADGAELELSPDIAAAFHEFLVDTQHQQQQQQQRQQRHS